MSTQAASLQSTMMDRVNRFLPTILKFVNSKPITAIKEGFMLTMPLTIIGSFFLLIAFVPIDGYNEFMAGIFGEQWATPLFQVVGSTFDILALIGVFGIAFTYVKYEGHNGINAGVLAIVSMLIVINAFIVAPDGTEIGGVIPKAFLGGKGMIAAILIGLSVGWIYAQVLNRNWVIKLPESVPEGVSNAFKSLIPGFIIISLAFSTYIFFDLVFDKTFIETIYVIVQTPLQSMSDSFFGAVGIALLISLLWWCGVHGPVIVMGIMGPIVTANALHNQTLVTAGEALIAGDNAKIVTNQFVDQFITVGGSGLTFGLVCCMVMFARSAQYKQLGRLSLIPGIFNINEPIIFATPIIFNPIMFIPFVLAPVTSAVMVYSAISFGLVGPFTAVQVPWTTPMILSGFIIGGWSAALLQISIFLMTICVYFPFFKYQDKLAAQAEK
ncbi:PTS sugar transporter subunit IIC [Photobacterium sp. DNB23_23_1]|uniref:Permease IIC component n=1 Tax=Photobacterium pectinilyticum TaxID=2906793 RepID=A0ABT1N6U8_9GAMM|nr:PTS sugar transporter subunit IIC [Photobacterium sp. ZSDE20]MCQ1060472.1 PTS sugar transporter subunit IIC [Photobacterium sp. ZSDE20]MDD1827872.1 PTS sugar transporter subunit IIC [Photobacterium sp. ZSDE20]